MRLLFLMLFLFTSVRSLAQSNSRIVFFRTESESMLYNASNSRKYFDALLRNGETIAKMGATSVFIYDTTHTRAHYSLRYALTPQSQSKPLSIRELNGAIAFVQIIEEAGIKPSFHLKVISLSEFENICNQSAPLRKRLNGEGFASVMELTQGFSVPTPDLVASGYEAERLPRKAGDTCYYDSFGNPTNRSSAVSFDIATADTGGLFLVKKYYLPGGGIQTIYHVRDLDSNHREGLYRHYYKSGRLRSKGYYRDNLQEGLWEYFYDKPSSPKWFTSNYKHGNKEGMLTSYYVNGKVKREEMHRHFSDTLFKEIDGIRQAYFQNTDSIISGRKFDKKGVEIPFTPFQEMPAPGFNLNEFLAQNLHYPENARLHDIEGRVVVQFLVNRKGLIEEAVVVNAVSEDLDREALRVVNAMPEWKPGLEDDEPINVYFTLPVTFRLD